MRACFIPLPSGLPPSELSPHRDRGPLSRPLCSPAVIHEVRGRGLRRLVTGGFPDAHARAWWPGSPADYGLPFHATRGPRFPFALDAGCRDRPQPPASSASKPCSPCESVPPRNRLFLSPGGRCSPGFRPSRASPLALGPSSHPLELRWLERAISARRRGARRRGHVALAVGCDHPGRRSNGRMSRRRLPGPSRAGPRRLSAADLPPRPLEPRAHPEPPIHGASKYARSVRSPRRPPALLGFLASSSTSQLRGPRRPELIASPEAEERVAAPTREAARVAARHPGTS